MTGDVKVLYSANIYVEDTGLVPVPTVAQVSARENCERLSILICPLEILMRAEDAGADVDMRDVFFDTCLN